jgi:hypothetical protein
MPYRLDTEHGKRTATIALTAVTSIIVIAAWIAYLNWTLRSTDEAPEPRAGDVFMEGVAAIRRTVETGLANSYFYFYEKARAGRTFKIEK